MLLNQEMKQKQTTSWLYLACCIGLVPRAPVLASFKVQSPLAVLLYQLASMEEGSSCEYICAWHQLRTLHKNLGK